MYKEKTNNKTSEKTLTKREPGKFMLKRESNKPMLKKPTTSPTSLNAPLPTSPFAPKQTHKIPALIIKTTTLALMLAITLLSASPALSNPAHPSSFSLYPANDTPPPPCPTIRWTNYGVFDPINPGQYNQYLTYNQFAQIMHNLLHYIINERYTYRAGHMYISHQDATSILSSALGLNIDIDTSQAASLLTHTTLALLLDSIIQIYIPSQTALYLNSLDLQDVYLEKALVINALGQAACSTSTPNPSLVILNIQGPGDIIIVPAQNGQILFNNINIAGSFFITQNKYAAIQYAQPNHTPTPWYTEQLMEITINNSSAASIHFLGQSSVSLLHNTDINSIHFHNAGAINTTLLNSTTRLPDVSISSPGSILMGNFNNVENNLHNDIIFLDATVNNFYSLGNVVLIGQANIINNHIPHYLSFYIMDPRTNMNLDLITLLGAIEHMLQWQFFSLHYSLTIELPARFNLTAPTGPPSLPLPDFGQGWPGPGTTPGPSPGPGSNYTRINSIDLTIIAPHIYSIDQAYEEAFDSLLPQGGSVQRLLSGQGFTGIIQWYSCRQNSSLQNPGQLNFGQHGSQYRHSITQDLFPFAGTRFVPNTIYVARISLQAGQGLYFAHNLNPGPNILNPDNLPYTQTTAQQSPSNNRTLVFYVVFETTAQLEPQTFSLKTIQGPFTEIHVSIPYMGELNAHNFDVRWGSNWETGQRIDVLDVSPFNPTTQEQGLYTLLLNETLSPNGTNRLFVKMVSPPYHIPYNNYVWITPQTNDDQNQDPAPLPSLTTGLAYQGDFITTLNFPSSQSIIIFATNSPNRSGFGLGPAPAPGPISTPSANFHPTINFNTATNLNPEANPNPQASINHSMGPSPSLNFNPNPNLSFNPASSFGSSLGPSLGSASTSTSNPNPNHGFTLTYTDFLNFLFNHQSTPFISPLQGFYVPHNLPPGHYLIYIAIYDELRVVPVGVLEVREGVVGIWGEINEDVWDVWDVEEEIKKPAAYPEQPAFY